MREAAGPKTWCRRCARWRKNSASGSRQTPAGTVSNNRARSGKVGTGFPKRSCSNKKIERDDDSKKSHPALGLQLSLEPTVLALDFRRARGEVGAHDRIMISWIVGRV